MKTITDEQKLVIVKAMKASDQMRANLHDILKAATMIANDEELRAVCGFNEVTSLDQELLGILSNPLVSNALTAPQHWAMRSNSIE